MKEDIIAEGSKVCRLPAVRCWGEVRGTAEVEVEEDGAWWRGTEGGAKRRVGGRGAWRRVEGGQLIVVCEVEERS